MMCSEYAFTGLINTLATAEEGRGEGGLFATQHDLLQM